MRIYDDRLGKFLSIDPLTSEYPYLTPYQFSANRPIDGIDLDGAEYLKIIPKFEVTGRGFIDYVKAADNGAIDVLNLAPSLWNSLVVNIQSVGKGTWSKDISNDLGQMGTGIKKTAVQFYHEPIKTITSPDALEFAVSTYIGGKVFTPGAKTGNLIKPANAATIEEKVTLYRGVNESHVDFVNSSKGIVTPNGGTATALEHNTLSTVHSPFTSWTPDIEVATNFALRPKGNGVILTAKIPISQLVKSPNTKLVQLIQNPSVKVSESEVLVKGKIKNAEVKTTSP